MKLIMKLSLIALSLLLTQSVLADSTTTATPITKPSNGFYIGGDIGVGTTNCDACNFSDSDDSASIESSNNGAAFNFNLGYQFNHYIALEAGFGKLPDLAVSLPDDFGSFYASTTHAYLAVKGMYPLRNNFSLFGKLGYDSMRFTFSSSDADDVTASSSASAVYLAVGAGYNFSPNWTASLSYNGLLASSDIDTTYTVSYAALGISYLFS